MIPPDVEQLAQELHLGIGLASRRIRQIPARDGDLTVPECLALARLDQDGSTTPGSLSKLEKISPQSMGATLASLETQDYVERRADPEDGRMVVMSITQAGRTALYKRRTTHANHMAKALNAHFTKAEMQLLRDAAPLLERLARNI